MGHKNPTLLIYDSDWISYEDRPIRVDLLYGVEQWNEYRERQICGDDNWIDQKMRRWIQLPTIHKRQGYCLP